MVDLALQRVVMHQNLVPHLLFSVIYCLRHTKVMKLHYVTFTLYFLASNAIDSYPDEPEKYPAFKCLNTVLRGMRNRDFIVHPFTMEMLSSLDKYALCCA